MVSSTVTVTDLSHRGILMNLATRDVQTMFDEVDRTRSSESRKNINIPTGKAGEVVAEMERRLILGYYKPGENLSFNMLAETFQVSRQPVSAAIAHLRASGYVEVLPQVGCRVVRPSPEEVHDFFLVLSKIDGAVAGLAAERHTASEAAHLLAIKPPRKIDALDEIVQRRDYISYIDGFHEQLWRMAKAPLLQGRFSGLRNLSSFYLWQGIPKLVPAAARLLIRERNDIMKAIIARDAKAAAELMEKHIAAKPRVVGVERP